MSSSLPTWKALATLSPVVAVKSTSAPVERPIQFFCCAVLTLLLAFMFEEPSLPAIRSGLLPLLYAGICSSGVAYSLQIMGQRDVEPSVASMILSLESCFSVIAGFLLLGTALSLRELLGCAVMFIGIIITQLPERKEEISS